VFGAIAAWLLRLGAKDAGDAASGENNARTPQKTLSHGNINP
jgi:hypothetical protein